MSYIINPFSLLFKKRSRKPDSSLIGAGMFSRQINLVPKQDVEKFEFKKKLLFWLSRSGRAIIIITEALVLLVFIFRFYYDSKIADLGESVENKVTVISERSFLEEKVRKIQEDIFKTRTVLDLLNDPYFQFKVLNSSVPWDIELDSIKIVPDAIFISARTKDVISFARLISNLTQSENILSVALKEANYSTEDAYYSFSMDIKIRQK